MNETGDEILLAIFTCLDMLTGLQGAKSMREILSERTQWYIGWLITLGWPIVVLVVIMAMGVEFSV